MAAVLLLLFSSYTVGRAVLGRLRISGASFVERLTAAVSTGLGMWCYALFFLGHVGMLDRRLLGGAAAVGSVPALVRLIRAVYGRPLPRFPRMRFVDACLAASVIIVIVITFLSCYAPVVGGIRNDEVGGRLSVPRDWAREGRITELSYPVSYMAGHGELLFLFAASISGEAGAKLVSWTSMLLCAAAAFILVRRHAGRRTAGVAGMLVVLNPLIFRTSFVAFVDLPATVFALMSLWGLFRYRETGARRYFLLSAFLLGVGIGAKATNYFYTAATVLFVAIGAWRWRGAASAVRHAVVFATVVSLFGAPWPLRNLILSGSPTFPPPLFLFDLRRDEGFRFSGKPYAREHAEEYFREIENRIAEHGTGMKNFLLLPWNITMYPESFSIGDSVGTVLLSFVPLALLLWPWPPWVRGAVLYAVLTGAAVYFMVIPEARYFMAAMAVLGAVSAWVYVKMTKRRHVGMVAHAALLLNAAFSVAVAVRICAVELGTVFSEHFRHERRLAVTPFVESFAYIDSIRPQRLVVLEADPIYYHLNTPYIEDSAALRHPELYRGAYVVDIDWSQRLERDLGNIRGWYAVNPVPPDLVPVFEGPDARVYRFK